MLHDLLERKERERKEIEVAVKLVEEENIKVVEESARINALASEIIWKKDEDEAHKSTPETLTTLNPSLKTLIRTQHNLKIKEFGNDFEEYVLNLLWLFPIYSLSLTLFLRLPPFRSLPQNKQILLQPPQTECPRNTIPPHAPDLHPIVWNS